MLNLSLKRVITLIFVIFQSSYGLAQHTLGVERVDLVNVVDYRNGHSLRRGELTQRVILGILAAKDEAFDGRVGNASDGMRLLGSVGIDQIADGIITGEHHATLCPRLVVLLDAIHLRLDGTVDSVQDNTPLTLEHLRHLVEVEVGDVVSDEVLIERKQLLELCVLIQGAEREIVGEHVGNGVLVFQCLVEHLLDVINGQCIGIVCPCLNLGNELVSVKVADIHANITVKLIPFRLAMKTAAIFTISISF